MGPDFQEIEGIKSYDIRYFNTNLLFNVLVLERPSVVVMLNASFITDRAIILACKKLDIKSVYFMHGDVMREEFREKTIESVNRRISQIQKILKASRHLKTTVINYLYSIWRYDWRHLLRFTPYKIILGTYFNPGTYLFFPPASNEIKPDRALVYGKLDKDFFEKKFDDADYAKVVGNPDLDNHFKNLEHIGENKKQFYEENQIPIDKPFVTYIEEGIVENKFWMNEDRISFINEICEICSEQGYNLVIKLHPRSITGPNRSSFNNLKNVVLLEQVDFSKLMYFTSICVSHYSTMLVFPMLLDKPIIVPRWGKSANLLTLNSDNDVTFVSSLLSFRTHLREKNFNYKREESLNKFVPYRDGKTDERVANYILELIK